MKLNSSALSNFLFFYLSVSVPLNPVLSSSPSSIPVPLIHSRPCLSLPHKSHVTTSGCSLCQRTWHSSQAQSHWAGFMNHLSLCPSVLSHYQTSAPFTDNYNEFKPSKKVRHSLNAITGCVRTENTHIQTCICMQQGERASGKWSFIMQHMSHAGYPHPIWHGNRTGQKMDSSYTTYKSVEIQYLDTLATLNVWMPIQSDSVLNNNNYT